MQFKVINVITDQNSWLNEYINEFIVAASNYCRNIFLRHHFMDVENSDLIFYLSYSKIVPKKFLNMHKHNLVVHGSNLPAGRGWSPVTRQILEGKNDILMTLFEATEELDDGCIYLQNIMHFEGHELIDELRRRQASCTFDLCLRFISFYNEIIKNARQQSGEASYYSKRTKLDSELSIHRTLLEQFNLLRTVDNEKYPAFFNYLGNTYIMKIEKLKQQ